MSGNVSVVCRLMCWWCVAKRFGRPVGMIRFFTFTKKWAILSDNFCVCVTDCKAIFPANPIFHCIWPPKKDPNIVQQNKVLQLPIFNCSRTKHALWNNPTLLKFNQATRNAILQIFSLCWKWKRNSLFFINYNTVTWKNIAQHWLAESIANMCKLIPYWTQNRMITHTNIRSANKFKLVVCGIKGTKQSHC